MLCSNGICAVYTCSKNDVISLVRNDYCALGLGLKLELGLRSELWLGLGLVEIRASVVDSF